VALTVSVALCTYDGARYLEPQLRSILAQSRLPEQIVVSDDGSRDETIGIAERTLAGSPIRVGILRREEPVGVTANFASAVAACDGDVVLLCDQDDVWRADRVERSAAAFEADPALLLLHSDARLIDGDGRVLPIGLLRSLAARDSELALIDAGRAFEVYLRRNLATGATTAFRRTLLEAALPFPAAFVHDEWLALIAAATGRVALDRAQLVDYRQHGANAIGASDPGIRARLRRMLAPRGDRYRVLADRADALAARLDALAAPEPVRELARRKRAFEDARARYPRIRPARVPYVLPHWASGDYRALSSQGDADVLRDLVAPA
jgi:glycosyltransferase involved in cell wall biosynthesis